MAPDVPRRVLGSSGLHVFPIGLGGMPMSISGRPVEAQSLATLAGAFASGIDLVDTADAYCEDDRETGHNERLIALAVREWDGPPIRIATKGGSVRPQGRWAVDGRPAHLRAACEASLKALGRSQLDLYQLHAPDDRVRFEDSVGELARLRAEGKVAHVGLSNVSVAQLRAAAAIVPVVSVQNRLSPHDTRAFRDGVLAECEQHGIAFLAYSPVGGRRGVEAMRKDAWLGKVAASNGATPVEVALAWLLAKSPVIVPIPGASKVHHARSSARAASLRLSDDDVATLDGVFLRGR
jgi:aryl-alcohol dehydrogenase-like predicted oxidoreductase